LKSIKSKQMGWIPWVLWTKRWGNHEAISSCK